MGSRGQAVWAPSLLGLCVGPLASPLCASLIRGTGVMTVSAPSGLSEDSCTRTLSGIVVRRVGAKWRLRLLPARCSESLEGRRQDPRVRSSCDFFHRNGLFPPGEVMPQARPGPASVREEKS